VKFLFLLRRLLMPKKYVVELSASERKMLQEIVAKGRVLARKRQHAHILLKADQGPGGPAWPDQKIAQALDVGVRTVERVRRRLVERGLDNALIARLDPHGPKTRTKLDGAAEARLCKLACSAAPKGHERWTLRLLAERLVQLEVVETISYETVRQALKKMNLSLG
jgi:transposase